jgi:hypothetical protein
MINKDQVSMDKVAQWLGWDRINLEIAGDQIRKLTEENQKLNEMLAQAKLVKKDVEERC